ncbi:MAG TPA: type II secretion system F family protein [Nitriliruptorales bacterium]
MVLIGAACGAGIGLGLLLILAGIRGTEPRPVRQPAPRPLRAEPALGMVGVAFVAALVVWVATGWVVGAALAATAAVTVPRSWTRAREQQAEIARTEAVAAWTEMLRDILAAAAGLEQAITTTAPTAPEPIRPEITGLASRLEDGDRLAKSLRDLADELANPAADLVVAALVTAAQREARGLTSLLDALARSTRAQAEMRLRVDASRARLRTAVRVVVGTLGLFAAGLIAFNPAYLEPYGTVEGQLVLLLVAAIFVAGFGLMQRMARIRTPARFLTRLHDESVEVAS